MSDPPPEFITALRRLGLVGHGEVVRGLPLDGGVSSDVWRMDLATGPVCVKRPLERLRVPGDWRASRSRGAREAAWLRLAAEIDPGAACPILGFDDGNGVLVLRWLDAQVWKESLLAGVVQADIAVTLGERLARLHAGTADYDADEWESARALFEKLRIAPYFRAAAERNSEVANRLLELGQQLSTAAITLVHGDVSPKNVLVTSNGPVLVDAECAAPGDPAFDVAFCISHLLLKAARAPTHGAALATASMDFVRAYRCTVTWESPSQVDMRAAALLPALTLARIDGLSPVEYLTDKTRAAVRAHSLIDLRDPPASLARAVDRWVTRFATGSTA